MNGYKLEWHMRGLRGTTPGRPIGRPWVVFDRAPGVELRGTGDELGEDCEEAGHDPDVRQECLESQEQQYRPG